MDELYGGRQELLLGLGRYVELVLLLEPPVPPAIFSNCSGVSSLRLLSLMVSPVWVCGFVFSDFYVRD